MKDKELKEAKQLLLECFDTMSKMPLTIPAKLLIKIAVFLQKEK